MALKTIADEALLIDELHATFPGIFARPLREYGANWADAIGVWTGGDVTLVGFNLFESVSPDPTLYNGRVLHLFEVWLERRGWWIGDYDGAVFHILPDGVLA
jgi:hypothetical protein